MSKFELVVKVVTAPPWPCASRGLPAEQVIPGFDFESEMVFEVGAEAGARVVDVLQRAMSMRVLPANPPDEVEALVVEQPGVLRFRTKGGAVGRVRKVSTG